MRRILVIKLSALGDMALSAGAFKALRQYHAEDRLTLLTTRPYVDLVAHMGYFDEILIDPRPKLGEWQKIRHLLSQLNAGFDRIYDLQLVDRTQAYHWLMWLKRPRPEWVGHARGASHRYRGTFAIHALDRHRAVLAEAGIQGVDRPDLRHLADPTCAFIPSQPYALLIPGSSAAHGGRKCWHGSGFAAVGRFLLDCGLQPLIMGGPGEDNHALAQAVPGCLDLTGKTTFLDILSLAAHAKVALGNDTGPLHMAAAMRIPIVGLFSSSNPPHVGGAVSDRTLHIYHPDLADLPAETVLSQLKEFLGYTQFTEDTRHSQTP